MKKSSLSFALRVISLLLGIVGVLLVLRSTEMGLKHADAYTESLDQYGAGGRFWLVQQSSIAAYRTVGAVLAGVGFFHALRPLSRLEMQRISIGESEETSHAAKAALGSADAMADRYKGQIQGTRTDTASRIIKASPQTLYWAFVDPDVLVRWLPPGGMRGRIERFEPKAGGSYRMVLTHNGGSGSFEGKSSPNSDIVEGRFVELIPGERIVQAVTFESPDPAYAGEMTMTWKLEAVQEGTQVTIVCEQVPGAIGKRDHEQALAESLANLERVVA